MRAKLSPPAFDAAVGAALLALEALVLLPLSPQAARPKLNAMAENRERVLLNVMIISKTV